MEEVRICDYCGRVLAEGEGTPVDDELLCDDCVEGNTVSPAITAAKPSGNRTASPMKTSAFVRTVSMPTTTAANPAGRSFRKASSAGTATCPTAKDALTSLRTRSKSTVTSPHPFSTETENDTSA